jgi:glycosyltransferase involved in cell wall biosynthesis
MKPSGVVLARNEESNIEDCLRSFAPHVDDLILIDMESEDRTVELARPFVTKILAHPLIPNFDSARNIAISEAKNDWLWFLDADERVSEAVGRLVSETIQQRGDEFVALTIPFKTFFCGQWIEHCGWWPGYTMPRVLKRGHFRFGEELHSGVKFDGAELRVAPREDLAIEHFSYKSVEHYLEKLNRYTSGEALTRHAKGEPPNWQRGIREMVRDLWVYYERNQGGLDGYRGWILSWLSGQYRWLTDAKLLDIPEQREAIAKAAVPQDLDEVFGIAQAELRRLRSASPRLPLAVQLRSPLFDPSGYADDGRTILKALALLERPVGAAEIRWSDAAVAQSPTDVGLLRSMLRQKNQGPYVAITNCITTLCAPDPDACLNTLRTTFETDRIPDSWLGWLGQYDEILVCAAHNKWAFVRSGVAPERIRILPQGVDTTLFSPMGTKLDLPPALAGQFVFLSVFDWQVRKGWDVLLKAYCQEFAHGDNAGLLLKISRLHGHSLESVLAQADGALAEIGQSLASRPDIVLFENLFAPSEMAALYRSAQAFVLASRGEGWGRPYLEAMACGLPTIGTTGSGNEEFMSAENSFLVDTLPVPVPEHAVREIPVYAGHVWREPNPDSLRRALRTVITAPETAAGKTKQALKDVQNRFSVVALSGILEQRIAEAEARFAQSPAPLFSTEQLRVELEGELFAGHSFSNINEQISRLWKDDPRVALSIRRRQFNPVQDAQVPAAHELTPLVSRELPGGAEVTIRHSFPPIWERPQTGKWVHIQPWEFGALPKNWIEPLRDQVDEIWAPSHYVRDVFVRSGISPEKIQVIPWGIDPEVYQPGLPDRILPTAKAFRFLFVGGTLPRKGFDLALQAYLQEFSRDDDVCLVIKDVGTQTFYRYGNLREQIFAAIADPAAPSIVYLDSEMTDGQRASLYNACQCLVAPYRGEGFGLPILEAMACGLAPIIPRGGPTDDFASEQTAYLLPARFVPCTHEWELCGQATELSMELADVRRAMRQAYEDRQTTQRLGAAASEHVRSQFTWRKSVERMTLRLGGLARGDLASWQPSFLYRTDFVPLDLSVCVVVQEDEATLANSLARVRPFVKQILVGDLGSKDRSAAIAREYGAVVVDCCGHDPSTAHTLLSRHAQGEWILHLEAGRIIQEAEMEEIAATLSYAADGNVLLRVKTGSGPDTRESNEPIILHRKDGAALDDEIRIQELPSIKSEIAEPKDTAAAPRRSSPLLDVAVVTIGYNLPGATQALLESALKECRHHVTFMIFSHSRIPEKMRELDELALRSDVLYRNYGENRGLARSWNEGIFWALDNNHDVVLVVNEDVLFAPGDLEKLADAAHEQQDKFLVMGRCFHENENGWSSSEYGCFAYNRLALDVLGAFDENFFPIYCEDSDYRRRAQLAGLLPGLCAETAIRHGGSASQRQPEVARQNGHTYAANRAYYARKWGGDAGQETFEHPFDDPRFSYYIDPQVCSAPYPGFNRSDRSLVVI